MDSDSDSVDSVASSKKGHEKVQGDARSMGGGNSARYDELINLPNNYNIGSAKEYDNVESINNDDSMIKTINIVEPGAASRIAAYSLL